MPVLTAKALETDPEGVARLRATLCSDSRYLHPSATNPRVGKVIDKLDPSAASRERKAPATALV